MKTTFASLQNIRDTPEVDKLINELQRADQKAIAARPFDLDAILSKWKADQTLDGRHELLKHNIDRHLKEINPDRNQRQPLNREKARRGCKIAGRSGHPHWGAWHSRS